MRFLGIGEYNSLGDMYWRLARAGHEVRVYVEHAEAHDIYAGMIERCESWRAQLPWIRAAGADGIIIFESAAQGVLQDRLRAEGFHVVGGCAWGDRLETDRPYAQQVMREAGMQTAQTWGFREFDAAIAFVRAHPARYVYKLNDVCVSSTRNYVGESDDGVDLCTVLEMERARIGHTRPDFVLMEHLSGVEVGIGAYFDGERFLTPALLDWEHKRFFPGDIGELTGEMGTVVTYRGAERIFDLTLARMAPRLRETGYCGYINLNTITNERGVWPLEFTCRFGYPGFAICDALHLEGWDGVLRKMIARRGEALLTREGFAVGVVLTVPPFPYEYGYAELSKGVPIHFRGDTTDAQRDALHFGEAGLSRAQLVTSGSLGYIAVATGIGADVPQAQAQAYACARQVVLPNLRYRNDIGDRLITRDYATLVALGYICPENRER